MSNIIITLQSSDGKEFKTDLKNIQCSKLITTMLENVTINDKKDILIPIKEIHSTILSKILDWTTYHHKNDPPPSTEPTTEEENQKRIQNQKIIFNWDQNFFNIHISKK